MNLEQLSHKALKTLRILLWIGLGVTTLGVLLFLSAYGTGASITRLYIIPALITIPGLALALPPGIILLKIWLIKRQIKDIKEKGEKMVKVAAFADKMYTKYTDKNKSS
jgi:hypothetical protein